MERRGWILNCNKISKETTETINIQEISEINENILSNHFFGGWEEGARHHSRHFTYVILFNIYNNPIGYMLLSSFYLVVKKTMQVQRVCK